MWKGNRHVILKKTLLHNLLLRPQVDRRLPTLGQGYGIRERPKQGNNKGEGIETDCIYSPRDVSPFFITLPCLAISSCISM